MNSADQIPFADENTLFRSSLFVESGTSTKDIPVTSPESDSGTNIPVTPPKSWANTERVSITPLKSRTPTTGIPMLPELSSNKDASTAPTESSAITTFTNIALGFSIISDSSINKKLEPSVTEISTENVLKKESDSNIESSKRIGETVTEVLLYQTEEKLREDCDSLSLWSKPDADSCRYYYLCVYGELTHRQCPEDYKFNPFDLVSSFNACRL